MKAVRVVDGRPTLVDAPEPVGDGVVIDIVAASICGSDLHLLDAGFAEGRVLGHEFAGLAPDGRPVAVEPLVPCESCRWCNDGFRHHCANGAEVLGVMLDGGMAERVVVPAEALVPLPSGLDVAVAALVEPLAVALHAVRMAQLAERGTVLVVGGGALGLMVVAALADYGLERHVVARHPHQAVAVERLGGRVVAPDDDLGGYSAVIDAAATPSSFATATRAVDPTGRIVLVGSPWSPLSIDLGLCHKEVTVVPSMGYAGRRPDRDVDLAARLLAADPAIGDALITDRFPLEAASDAFAAAADRASGTIKVLIEP